MFLLTMVIGSPELARAALFIAAAVVGGMIVLWLTGRSRD